MKAGPCIKVDVHEYGRNLQPGYGQPGDLMTPEDKALRATSTGPCPCCGTPLYARDPGLCCWCWWQSQQGGCHHLT